MNAFEEFMFDDKYVLRFYRGDHGLICTINESMVSELREVESRLRQQQAEIEALKSVVYWLKENRPEVWEDIQKWRKAQSTCNGFCGEYECKENQAVCKRKAK